MTGQAHAWEIEFYTDERNRCQVREFIRELPETERAQVTRCLQLLEEQGIGLRLPYARSLVGHKGLWELRPGDNRAIYFLCSGRKFIMLHAFRKKGRKTPPREIAVAEKRMYEFLEREDER